MVHIYKTEQKQFNLIQKGLITVLKIDFDCMIGDVIKFKEYENGKWTTRAAKKFVWNVYSPVKGTYIIFFKNIL